MEAGWTTITTRRRYIMIHPEEADLPLTPEKWI
jgi:hypothetical protein